MPNPAVDQLNPVPGDRGVAHPRASWPVRRVAVVVLAGSIAAALPTLAGGASPPLIPKAARYVGTTSSGTVARIFVSRNGGRIGYTIFANLGCENGAGLTRMYWTTEGEAAADYSILPGRDGSFMLNSSNLFELTDGNWGNAAARFAGRFRTSRLVSGTFSSRVDYFDASGKPLTRCSSGNLTWKAKRTR